MTVSRYLSRLLTFAVILFCATFLATVGLIRHADAADWGPIPGPGAFACDGYWIDPPTEAHVTAASHVDDVTATQTVTYDGNATHRANFTWTEAQAAQLAIPGPHAVGADFTWDIGAGTTTLSDTLTCTEIPPPETTVPPTTTTTTVAPPHDTDHPTPPPAVADDCDATPTPASCLPHTGTNPAPLALGGFGMLGLGAVIVRKFRVAR